MYCPAGKGLGFFVWLFCRSWGQEKFVKRHKVFCAYFTAFQTLFLFLMKDYLRGGGWVRAGQTYYNIGIRKVLSSHKTQPWQENNACWVRRGEVELVAKLSEEQGTNNWTQDDWRTQCSPSVNFLNNPWFWGLTIKSICGQENEKRGNPILLSSFLKLAMKLSLYSALNLACLSASAWRERKRGKHNVLFLFKVPLFLLGFGAYREPSCGARGPCWSPLICLLPWSAASTQGLMSIALAQFPCFGQNSQGSGKRFHDQSWTWSLSKTLSILEIWATWK